ncbi:hypothetical protein ACIQYF_13685 [Pseudomonas sp. NPDC096917]|uniref:hypothetical protein n=1 Tax=Pseudomonas sp. NPDC096917 TaxID=3364483 RepID=UPI00383BB6A3
MAPTRHVLLLEWLIADLLFDLQQLLGSVPVSLQAASLAKFDTLPEVTKAHVAQGGVARSLLGATQLHFSRLALHHAGFRRGCNETGTDPRCKGLQSKTAMLAISALSGSD